MEPNKLDFEIQQKLEVRTIQPSAQAWGQLEAMLDAKDKTNEKHNYKWIYIAASFVGLLIISSVFLNLKEPNVVNSDKSVVIEETPTINKQYKSSTINETVTPSHNANRSVVVRQVIAENTNAKGQPNQVKDKVKVVSISNVSKENATIVSSSESKVYQSTNKNKYITAENLLAAVSNIKLDSKTTDKTIEKNRKGTSVDPSSLLSSVETELNQSYRESALDKISKKFNVLKTAVANRNYEE
ncbi:hypothetical protein [Flavobacterium sp. K5-23]|uniref:hypothetical protein n=1 Tax=Flavobacterium sp. K5-23 TaxID=2746225 RepID=UPI00200DD2E8|nr:hypothetical protein [Flavobacterium sp. K5-23]UQD55068.1 hypothetical protein FLAK523_01155 [Flavobacterium sp. K5-23]